MGKKYTMNIIKKFVVLSILALLVSLTACTQTKKLDKHYYDNFNSEAWKFNSEAWKMYGCPEDADTEVCMFWHGVNAKMSINHPHFDCSDGDPNATPPEPVKNYSCCVGLDCFLDQKPFNENDHIKVLAEGDPADSSTYFNRKWKVTLKMPAIFGRTNCDLTRILTGGILASGDKLSSGEVIEVEVPKLRDIDSGAPLSDTVYACRIDWSFPTEEETINLGLNIIHLPLHKWHHDHFAGTPATPSDYIAPEGEMCPKVVEWDEPPERAKELCYSCVGWTECVDQ